MSHCPQSHSFFKSGNSRITTRRICRSEWSGERFGESFCKFGMLLDELPVARGYDVPSSFLLTKTNELKPVLQYYSRQVYEITTLFALMCVA